MTSSSLASSYGTAPWLPRCGAAELRTSHVMQNFLSSDIPAAAVDPRPLRPPGGYLQAQSGYSPRRPTLSTAKSLPSLHHAAGMPSFPARSPVALGLAPPVYDRESAAGVAALPSPGALMSASPERSGPVFRSTAGAVRQQRPRAAFNVITARFQDSAVERERALEEERSMLPRNRADTQSWKYDSGRVANGGIVSKHSPAFFQEPFENNSSYLRDVEDYMVDTTVRQAPKPVPRPNFDRALEPSWGRSPDWFESPYKSNADGFVDFAMMMEKKPQQEEARSEWDKSRRCQMAETHSSAQVKATTRRPGVVALRDAVVERLERRTRPNILARRFLALKRSVPCVRPPAWVSAAELRQHLYELGWSHDASSNDMEQLIELLVVPRYQSGGGGGGELDLDGFIQLFVHGPGSKQLGAEQLGASEGLLPREGHEMFRVALSQRESGGGDDGSNRGNAVGNQVEFEHSEIRGELASALLRHHTTARKAFKPYDPHYTGNVSAPVLSEVLTQLGLRQETVCELLRQASQAATRGNLVSYLRLGFEHEPRTTHMNA